MSDKAGILCLGTRPDASTFEKGCAGLGFDVPLPIKKPAPTMDELKRFFAASYDWVFFAGHFGSGRLCNEQDTVGIRFAAETITLEAGGATATLRRGTAELQVAPRLVVWGGCSTLGSRGTVGALHSLFGTHTMLGFKGLTGWRVVNALLGEEFMKGKPSFFTKASATSSSAELTSAWMDTAKAGYGGGDLEDRFAAVDDTGQRWVLRDKKVARDAKLY